MNKPVKLPEIRKEAFAKARENLGLSTKDLSGMACLSVRQIEQIENGEFSSFYGAQVKVTAAKKVAGLLKMSEADAFDFGEAAPAKKEDAKKIDQEVKQEIKQDSKRAAKQAAKQETPLASVSVEKKSTPALTPSTNASIEMNSTKQGVAQESDKSKKKIFLLVSIAAALVFSIVNLRPLFLPETPKEEPTATQEAPVAPAESPDPKVAAPTPEATAPAPVTPPAPAASTTAPAAAATPECPAVDAAAVNYKPDAPKKAGDMVYLQSKTAQTVCVVDASGKTQNKTLEPGVGASIYGKPPLKVMTSGLNQVDVYYQGSKVRLGNTSAKTLILEQAEIIQPLAPTDSQLR